LKRYPLYDQNGVFQVDGDTDVQHTTKWGFHGAALWDYDGSGQQHLIVGTDKGLLYLIYCGPNRLWARMSGSSFVGSGAAAWRSPTWRVPPC
jgi:hypothetical protein